MTPLQTELAKDVYRSMDDAHAAASASKALTSTPIPVSSTAIKQSFMAIEGMGGWLALSTAADNPSSPAHQIARVAYDLMQGAAINMDLTRADVQGGFAALVTAQIMSQTCLDAINHEGVRLGRWIDKYNGGAVVTAAQVTLARHAQ